MSKEKDWVDERLLKFQNRLSNLWRVGVPYPVKALEIRQEEAHSIRQELVRRIEGKKMERHSGDCAIYDIDCQTCTCGKDSGYNAALDEVIKEISEGLIKGGGE